MSRFRTIACTMVAALCALGLSVGAALAEGESAPQFDQHGKPVKTGVCFLHKVI